MKKLALVLLSIILFLSGCSKDNNNTSSTNQKTIDEVFDIAKENMDTTTMEEGDEEMLALIIQLEKDMYEEVRYLYPETNLNLNQILVVKSKDPAAVQKKLEAYIKNEIEIYESYLPEEAIKLKDAELFQIDGLNVLLVGESKEENSNARSAIEK